MERTIRYFITWTTYGTWLPGDARGWRRRDEGEKLPEPILAQWCKNKMLESPFFMSPAQRKKVDRICEEHAARRHWELAAVKACSNHVHLAVEVGDEFGPKKVRDQFKANATRCLRCGDDAVVRNKFWTKGGDTEVVGTDEDWETVQIYILEAQDLMEHGK